MHCYISLIQTLKWPQLSLFADVYEPSTDSPVHIVQSSKESEHALPTHREKEETEQLTGLDSRKF